MGTPEKQLVQETSQHPVTTVPDPASILPSHTERTEQAWARLRPREVTN